MSKKVLIIQWWLSKKEIQERPDWIMSSGLWDDDALWEDEGMWNDTPKEETDIWDDETYWDDESIE